MAQRKVLRETDAACLGGSPGRAHTPPETLILGHSPNVIALSLPISSVVLKAPKITYIICKKVTGAYINTNNILYNRVVSGGKHDVIS